MLRKLFGFWPVRLPRPLRTGTRAPAARTEVAPQRRKPVLEALESRLLLSADPLGALDAYGVLALQFGDGNDQALIEWIGASAAGGDIVAVTLGSITQHYGDEFSGIVRLLIDAGAGDDSLRIVGVTVTTEIIGGLGTDTFEWQRGDATWSITDRDTGQVETASFSSFEHLVGGDDNRDTFLFAAGALVSGGVEGGAGGFDSFVIQGGDYEHVTYTVNASDADTIALDDHVMAFDGIEAGTLGATAASLTLNATSADDVVRLREDAVPGQALFESVTGTFTDLAFVSPIDSFTIDLGAGDDRFTVETFDRGFSAALDVRGGEGRDRIDFTGTVATHGHDLSAAAETIVVAPGSVLRTDLGADGAVGDLVLAAAAASTDARGTADSSVTVDAGTLIARNVTISATATFTANAEFIDGGSTAAVAIFGGSEVAAAETLAIDVRSFVSAATDAAQADVTVTSTAAARIGGAATLEAGGDLAIDVVNAVDVTAAGGPVAIEGIAIETIVLVDGDATLTGQDVSLHAASAASLAVAGVVAAAEFESATYAGMAGEVAIDLGRRTSLAIADGNARALAGLLAAEALRPDFERDPAHPLDPGEQAAAGSDGDSVAADLYRVATGGPLPEADALPADLYRAGPADPLDSAIAADLAAAGMLGFPAEPQLDQMPDADGVIARSTLAGSIALLAVTDGDVDARGGRRPGVETEQDDGEGDAGLGASLALSMIKDSALAELARSVASSGTVVLSASGAPFARGRARGAPGSAEAESGGALEIRDADAAGAVIVAEVDESAGNAAPEGGDPAVDDRDALRFAGAGELVLATAARHDLVAEASGGAERGTAVSAATAIDVASAEAAAEPGAADTFTLAVLPDPGDRHGADLHDAADGGFAGLALSTHLPALEFEVPVGGAGRDGPADAIRSGDDVDALAGTHAIAVSGLLDPAVLAPAAAPGGASGHDVSELVRCLDADVTDDAVAASAEVAIGDSRQVVMAYLGALAAPIAASAGLTQHARHRDAGTRVGGDRRRPAAPGATGYASRAEFGGHRDAFRGGGGWAEKFVNELGLAPEDQNPNAKIKIKL